ncbi:MAG: MATE family efflux transporter [Bacteroidales bacterium]|nr:MATE family efflux transporter [Bacteroidales bacterium]
MAEKDIVKENTPDELGTEPIGKLLLKYAVPAIIAMTASSLYNIIDSIFIGHGVGPYAITGLAVTFPFMNLSTAFGAMIGVGGSTIISIFLGQQKHSSAKKVLSNVVGLNVVLGLLFMIFSFIFLDPILYFFGASDVTIGYAREYMQIILLGNVVTHLYLGLNSLLRASGHPKKAMAATFLTVILNTILDPLFIFVFDMGIQGAAWATVLAQIVSLVWLLKIFNNKTEVVHFEGKYISFDKKIIRRALSIGLSPFLMNFAACFVVIIINQSLKKYGGDLAIGAYGIVNRVVFLVIMVVMGLNQGMQPIAGYNFGAGDIGRVRRVLKLTIYAASIITTTGFLIGELLPTFVVSMFTTDSELIKLASEGLRLTVIAFPIVGFQMVVSNFFQCIGMAGRAIFFSLSRQVLFLIPGLLIFPTFFESLGVWISMPISDFVASIVAAIMLIDFLRKWK